MVRSDPALRRQLIGCPGPALPLIVERCTGMEPRAALRYEDVVDCPVGAAGAAHPLNVPASRHDLAVGAGEITAPIGRLAVRAPAWRAVIEDLKASQHPGGFG